MALKSGSSPRVAYASDLGCKLDVDLRTGRTANGGPATDNTGALNAFLAQASAANPVKLILDGPSLVRGLVIAAAGYTTIEGLGWGTGIFLADGANQDAIRIGAYTGGQTEGQGVSSVPPREATTIVLRDFSIFGNGTRSFTGTRQGITPPNAPVPGAPEHAIFGVAFTNCHGVLVEHVQIVEAACYGLLLANASDVQVVACNFVSHRSYQDGVHLDGPTERVCIRGCRFETGDDAIAVNAPEGCGGDIEDVQVADCVFVDSFTAMRVYTSDRATPPARRVRRVVVSGCTGTTIRPSFNLGIEGEVAARNPQQLEDMLIAGCSLGAPGMVELKTPAGLVVISDCAFRQTASAAPVVAVRSLAQQVTLSNVTVLRGTGVRTQPVALVEIDLPGAVGTLTLAGVRVLGEGGAMPVLPALVSARGPLDRLVVEAADMAGIAALAEPETGFAMVGKIAGAGLLGTGERIPDGKVEANTLYRSAETGAPSIQLGSGVIRLG